MNDRLFGAAVALALTAGCAPYSDQPRAADRAEATGSRQCFFLSQVDGYSTVKGSRDRIRVSTGPRDRYEFEVFGPCPYLGDTETMGFDQAGGGTICSGIDVDLIVPTPHGGPPQRCAVRMIRKLPPDETG